MLVISQGAVFDISTISGTAQSVTIQFRNGDAQPMDVSGYTFRSGIRGPGAVGISVTGSDATDEAVMAWSKLKAGEYTYDVFLVASDGTERQILRGTITAASRVTPSNTEDVVTIADVVVTIPDDPSGTITITDQTTNAADRAEAAAESAETDAASASASATSATASATSASASASAAATSASTAQAALDAIPQVDASGNMTLAGGLTTGGAINANGGINKPLTVLPTTAQSVVNRNDAFGAYCVQECCSGLLPISGMESSSTSMRQVTDVAGHIYSLRNSTKTNLSGKFKLSHLLWRRENYSGFRGFMIPITPDCMYTTADDIVPWVKITIGLGVMPTLTWKDNADVDTWRVSPRAGGTWNINNENMGRIIDITFFPSHAKKTTDGCLVRTRLLKWNNTDTKWEVFETNILSSNFNTSEGCIHNLVYHQTNCNKTTGKAGLWASVNGYNGHRTIWLADLVPVFDTFDSNGLQEVICVDSCYGNVYMGNVVSYVSPGTSQDNGAYNAFKAVEYRRLLSESTYEFTPYELEEN